MSQEKVSIPKDEWQIVQEYHKNHEEKLKLKRIRSPIMLLRYWILEKYPEDEQQPISGLELITANSSFVQIFDRKLTGNRSVPVALTPTGLRCEYHKTSDCEHTQYTLQQETVKKIIRQKRKDGWSLPRFSGEFWSVGIEVIDIAITPA